MTGYRDRIYRQYIEARGTASAPPDVAELDARSHTLQRVVSRYFPANRDASVLDLGCGYGALVRAAHECGYRGTWGVDRSAQQVAAATRLGITGVREGDLVATLQAQPDASHDVIVTFDVIEHLTKDEIVALADDVRRVLRPGGRWIIHAPNAESPMFGRIRYGDFTHEQAFTRFSISQLLLSSGFKQVMCEEDGPVVHGAKSAARWLLWKFLRGCLRIYLAAETGSVDREAIFTQNLIAVATK